MTDAELKSNRGVAVLGSAFCLVVTLTSGIYGTVFWLGRDQGPTRPQHEQASAALRENYEADELIILLPHYATMAREFLGDLHPVASRKPLALDWSGHRRVWVYALFGAGQNLHPEIEAAGHHHDARVFDEYGITVDVYSVTSSMTTVYSFRDRLKDARVFHELKSGVHEPCDQWSDTNGQGGVGYGRWSCQKDKEWFYVAPQWHRMGDHLELCLWAHPPNEGKLVIQFADVPMNGDLHGFAGHTLNGSLHARAPIDLEVSISGQAPQTFRFELDEYYRRFALETPKARTATVTFKVSTRDAGANHFCFSAGIRK